MSLLAKARVAERGPVSTVLDFPDPIPGSRRGLHPRPADRLRGPPPGLKIPENTYYNPYFLSAVSLAMPPPLTAGQVAYTDRDADHGRPIRPRRNRLPDVDGRTAPRRAEAVGFEVFIFLLVFAGLMYLTKKRVWPRSRIDGTLGAPRNWSHSRTLRGRAPERPI